MKKTLVAAIIGLAAVASVKGQGQIIMYNVGIHPGLGVYYAENPILYGTGSGGTLGLNISGAQWTIAMYGVAGNSVATINGLFAGDGGNGVVGGVGGLALASGTATIWPGEPIGVYGSATPPNQTSATFAFSGTGTFVLVAYNGASYNSSTIRGHSAAFTATAAVSPATPSALTGSNGDPSAPQFSVSAVPEPSTFALAGLGLAGLLIFRRRK